MPNVKANGIQIEYETFGEPASPPLLLIIGLAGQLIFWDEELCKHSSNMETRAADAERASVKYKQVEFMQDHIGKVYPGVISGVTDWGIYVELENKIEGMVPIRELDDDFYFFDEKNYALVGRHTKKTYQLGDDITVKIWRTNLERKQLDLLLANNKNVSHFK